MRLHDSRTGRVRPFEPLRAGEVRMYHCGPTVYKRQHIGNFRAFVLADLLRRSFEMQGLSVLQIMNITDVGHLTEDDVADASGEDKLQKEAARRSLDPTLRGRVAVVAAGTLVAFALPAALTFAESLTGGRSPQNALALTGMVFPLAVAYGLSSMVPGAAAADA